MLEGGTQGSRGHTLVVVPHLTESYAKGTPSSDGAIPLCTLKNFPHRIEHTLQVARGGGQVAFSDECIHELVALVLIRCSGQASRFSFGGSHSNIGATR